MSDTLKSCPCCGGNAALLLQRRNGIPSGDVGTEATIICNQCHLKLVRWALKKSWAKKSALVAWNTRIENKDE
jgi:C4-type Zn-finger protein